MTMLVNSATAASPSYYTSSTASGPMGVAAALAALKANARAKVTISDSAANLEKNFDALNKLANNITQITQSDADQALKLSATQLQKGATLLSKLGTDYTLNISGVTAGNATKVATNTHVTRLSVNDSSANISSKLNDLSLNDKLVSVNLTTPATSIMATAAQVDGLGALWDKMGSSYGLTVTQATSAQAASYASDLRIKSVAILDSTAGISAKLDDLKGLGLRLKEIRTTANQPALKVSADQVRSDALVIGKIYSNYQLAVFNASAAQAQALTANRKVVSMDVVDTAANVAQNLALLDKLDTHLKTVHITDLTDAQTDAVNPLSLSSKELAIYSEVLDKIDTAYTLAVKGADVNEAQTLAADERVTSIAVSDSSGGIASALDALKANGKVVSITQTGKAAALSMTAAQLAQNTSTLAKLQGSYTLSVSGVSAADALSLASTNGKITSLSVSDTGSVLTDKLADLSALGKKLTSVTQSDTGAALNLSASDWVTHIGTLSKIKGGYAVAVSGVSAASAQKFASDNRVRSVAVADTGAAIASKLDVLHSLGQQLTGITQSDTGAVAVTAAQRTHYGQTLAKLGEAYTLAVRGAQASEAAAMKDDDHVASIAVADTSANIAAQLDALQGNTKLSTITQLGKAQPLALTMDQFNDDADALAKIQGNYTLALSGVSASAALTQAQNSKVSSLSVSDTGAGIVANLSNLARAGSKLASIRDTDSTPLLSMKTSEWGTYGKVLGKVDGGYRVSLTDVRVAEAATVAADEHVQSMVISDSTSAIASQITGLQALGPQITAITRSDTDAALSITLAQRSAAAGVLSKLDEGYTLALRDVTAGQAQALVDDEHVQSIAISDTSANIAAQLAALNGNDKITSLTQTGTATALAITAQQMVDNDKTLGMITGNYSLALSQVEAYAVADLTGNAKVASMAVVDTADNLLANLGDLKAAGKKLTSLSQSGTPEVLEMTHATWVANQTTLDKFTAGYDVQLSDVNAASAAAVASNLHVRSFAVTDTAAHITSSLDALQSAGPSLTGIALTDPSTLIKLSAAQMLRSADALGKIDSDVSLAVSGASAAEAQSLAEQSGVVSVAVSDSSDNIAAQLDALQANAKVSRITQTGEASVMVITAAQMTANAGALGKISGAYTLDVREALAADAASLDANSHVVSLAIADSSSHVGAVMAALNGLGKLDAIGLTEDDGAIELNQSQLDDWSDTLDKIQNTYRLSVTGVTTANIERLSADDRISALSVNATSQQISESFDDLVSLGGTLTQVSLSTPNTPIAISQSQWQGGAAVLAKLPEAHQLNLTEVASQDATRLSTQAHVQGVSVADTASNIAANFDDLLALGEALESVMVTDDSDVVVTQDQIDGGTSLLAKFLGDHNIEPAA
jgi:hypothetical protein